MDNAKEPAVIGRSQREKLHYVRQSLPISGFKAQRLDRSVILGIRPEKESTISAELKAKGLNYLRCTLSELRCYGAPTLYQPAFKTYIALLPAFMRACQTRINVDVREFGQPVSIKYANSIPFPYPDICATTTKATVEETGALLSLGGELTIIRQNKVYKFSKPTRDTIKALVDMKTLNKTCQAADGMVNMSGFDTFKLTVRIFSEFTVVHRYPAYLDPSHYWTHLPDRSFEYEEKEENLGKRKRGAVEDSDEAAHKRKKGSAPSHDDITGRSAENKKDLGHEVIQRIKTLPEPAKHPWALSVTSLPNTYGLFVPYVSQLFFYDTNAVPQVIAKYFLSSLGSTKENCLRQMELLKGDWGVLGKTEVGKQLSHFAFCIDAALQCQARPIPLITEGRYVGVFISGYGFQLKIQGTDYFPVPFEEVLKAIEETTTHSKVLAEVLSILGIEGSLDDAMSEVAKITKDPETTMMTVRAIALSAKVSVADKAKILELGASLDFRNPQWPTNSNSISRALDFIADVSKPLPMTLPLHHSMLFSTDRLEVVWSCFGVSAPTFRPSGGIHVGLSDTTYTFTTKKGPETITEEKSFDVLHVSHAELNTAIADMNEVRNTKKVGILRQFRRESKNVLREFKGPDFTRVKEGLDKFADVGVGKGKEKEKEAPRVELDLDVGMDDDDI